MAKFCIECSDMEGDFHEIVIEAEDSIEAEEIARDENPGLETVYSIVEV